MGLFKFLKEKFSKKKVEDSDKESQTKNSSDLKSLEKYDQGLEKSRKNFSSKLDELAKKYKNANQEYFEELEEILIEADCGVSFTINTIEDLLEETKKENITDPKQINEMLVDKMFLNYLKEGKLKLALNILHYGSLIVIFIITIMFLAYSSYNPFIYFRF